uniref:hypothetical protein n=1 Tax=Ornithinimicrobium sufpigmenti TaxID=2508882 RepID=UPI0037C540EB
MTDFLVSLLALAMLSGGLLVPVGVYGVVDSLRTLEGRQRVKLVALGFGLVFLGSFLAAFGVWHFWGSA